MPTLNEPHRRGMLVLFVVLALATIAAASPAAAQAAPAPLYFTTSGQAGQDLFSVRPNGTGLTRLTRSSGARELDEVYPTARGNRVLFQMRVTSSAIASFGGITYIAVGSKYDIVEYKKVGKKSKLSLPFTNRFQSSRLPLRKRFSDFGSPAFAPTGKLRIALSCRTPFHPVLSRSVRTEMCIYDYATRKLRVVTNCGCVSDSGAPVRLSWSRNGRYVAFASGQKLYRVDVPKKRVAVVHDAARLSGKAADDFFSHASLSPDGRYIVARWDQTGSVGLRVVDVAKRTSRVIAPPNRNDEGVLDPETFEFSAYSQDYYGTPSFSPDGKRIGLTIGYNTNDKWVPNRPPGVYTMNLDGGDLKMLVKGTSRDFNFTTGEQSLTWGS